MRLRIMLLLAAACAPALAEAAECIGRKPSARTLVIVYACPGVESSNVRWFLPRGEYGDQFTAEARKEFVAPPEIRPIKPADIPMAFEGGGDCVAGEAITLEGRCIARYHLPCAVRRFELSVNVDPSLPLQGSVSYSVLRSIRRKGTGRRCDLTTEGQDGKIYSDSEQIQVSVFLNTPETLPLTARQERLPFCGAKVNLAEVGDAQTVACISPNATPDRVRGAPSDNARWLMARAPDAATDVKIEVKKVE